MSGEVRAAQPRGRRRLAVAAAAGLLLAAGIAAAGDSAAAVTTSGSGVLTMCRDWLVFNSCTTYGNVVVPKHIAVGDAVVLTYGSNPKDYRFHIVRIRRDGESCAVFSDHSGTGDDGERLEIAQCRAAGKPAAAR